jgi:hypothetical protein
MEVRSRPLVGAPPFRPRRAPYVRGSITCCRHRGAVTARVRGASAGAGASGFVGCRPAVTCRPRRRRRAAAGPVRPGGNGSRRPGAVPGGDGPGRGRRGWEWSDTLSVWWWVWSPVLDRLDLVRARAVASCAGQHGGQALSGQPVIAVTVVRPRGPGGIDGEVQRPPTGRAGRDDRGDTWWSAPTRSVGRIIRGGSTRGGKHCRRSGPAGNGGRGASANRALARRPDMVPRGCRRGSRSGGRSAGVGYAGGG